MTADALVPGPVDGSGADGVRGGDAEEAGGTGGTGGAGAGLPSVAEAVLAMAEALAGEPEGDPAVAGGGTGTAVVGESMADEVAAAIAEAVVAEAAVAEPVATVAAAVVAEPVPAAVAVAAEAAVAEPAAAEAAAVVAEPVATEAADIAAASGAGADSSQPRNGTQAARAPFDGLNLWRGVSRSGRVTRIGLAAAVAIACAADLPGPRSAPVVDDQQTVSALEPLHHGAPPAADSGKPGRAGGEILPSGGVKAGKPDCSPTLPAGWLREENQIPGTSAWQDAKHTRAGSVNGYLSRASVQCGDTVTAYLSSPVPVSGASLSAYRMGYYNGAGGRLVWQTKHLSLDTQAQATVTGPDVLTEAPWKPTLTFHVTGQWTPGYYLLVLRAPGQTPSSMPLVVRADGDTAPLGFQASVLTYQAYNTFGGHSAYADPARKGAPSTEVSFDRPYEDGGYYSPYQYELPLIREMEKLGIDVDYFTDLDVDADPGRLKLHKGIVTGGHSEYWTKRMYDGAVAARQAGVNLAFFGANGVYTAARLTGSPLGPDRRVVIRRSTAGDSVAAADPSQATVNWAEAPLNRPESALIGQGYGYLGANGSLRVLHPSSWIFADTGVTLGQVLPNTVGGEYDQVEVNKPTTPRDIDVLAAMPMRFKNGHAGMATTTYYVATSQAGIFDAGTTYWPCVIAGDCLHLAATPPDSRRVITQMTDNILTAFAAGPAGLAHASTPNLPPSAEGLVASAKQPGDVSVREY